MASTTYYTSRAAARRELAEQQRTATIRGNAERFGDGLQVFGLAFFKAAEFLASQRGDRDALDAVAYKGSEGFTSPAWRDIADGVMRPLAWSLLAQDLRSWSYDAWVAFYEFCHRAYGDAYAEVWYADECEG